MHRAGLSRRGCGVRRAFTGIYRSTSAAGGVIYREHWNFPKNI